MALNSKNLAELKLETAFETTPEGDTVVVHTSLSERLLPFPLNILGLYQKVKVQTRWKQTAELGAGTFGMVWLQENEEGDKRAVKGVFRNRLKASDAALPRELELLAELREYKRSFVEFLAWYEDKHHIYFVMEYVEHGDLHQYLKKFGEKAKTEAREITRQLLRGLAILYLKRICHRDLKPKNILVASTSPIWVKIADFGVSKLDNGTYEQSAVGTMAYRAPESLGLVPYNFRPEIPDTILVADMWSLGFLVHETLTSEIPFAKNKHHPIRPDPEPKINMNALSTFCSSKHDVFPEEALHKSVAGQGLEFLKRLLVPNPDHRMTALEALRHRWLFEDPRSDLEGSDDGLRDLDDELEGSENVPPPNPVVHDRSSDFDSRLIKYASVAINDEPADSNKAISAIQRMRLVSETARPHPIDLNFDGDFQFDRQMIQYTAIAVKRVSGSGRDMIIDSVPSEGPGAITVVRGVRRLASILHEAEPMTFGILVCSGIVKVKGPTGKLTRIEMVFDVPQELENPRSLRTLLLSLDFGNGQHLISARIQLAKRLARTVFFLHSANLLHKDIRPETIIIFDPRNNNKNQIGLPFLVGFRKARPDSGGYTELMGDEAWEQNIYRHPERQGDFPEQAYRMQHDIYSLGVCLLEIALWKSYVIWDEYGNIPSRSAESEFLIGENPWEVKGKLVAMAREMIPKSLGDRYAAATIQSSWMGAGGSKELALSKKS